MNITEPTASERSLQGYDCDKHRRSMITIKTFEIDGARVQVTGEDYAPEEIAQYVKRGAEMYGDDLNSVEIMLDGEYADITYYRKPVPFQRIRRITGYLTGTSDRWNNAKKAELKDRIKHDA